jgi:hypothetical protein
MLFAYRHEGVICEGYLECFCCWLVSPAESSHVAEVVPLAVLAVVEEAAVEVVGAAVSAIRALRPGHT